MSDPVADNVLPDNVLRENQRRDNDEKKKDVHDHHDEPWHNGLTKLLGVFGFQDGKKEIDEKSVTYLMEVVGATGIQSQWNDQVDPYCHVYAVRNNSGENTENKAPSSKSIHQTKTVYNDANPIWTVHTDSLCLVEIPLTPEQKPPQDEPPKEDVQRRKEDANADMVSSAEHKKNDTAEPDLIPASPPLIQTKDGYVQVEVNHGNTCLGVVAVPFMKIVNDWEPEERIEFPIRRTVSTDDKEGTDDVLGMLALRFKPATGNDMNFLQPHKHAAEKENAMGDDRKRKGHTRNPSSNDINFKAVQGKAFAVQYQKYDRKLQAEVFRCQPGPDPERVEETTWMTREKMEEEAMKPSKHWVEAGYGHVGQVYIEILGCDGLPNLDIGAGNLTDPFIALCFEDTMVRTDVLHDTLDPRWMPWSTRAFCLKVYHPSSLLMIGVFDYDSGLVDNHDPVGRVVLNLTNNFTSGTSYLLHYRLHDDPQQQDDRGVLIMRLRIEWAESPPEVSIDKKGNKVVGPKQSGEARMIAASYTNPPRFLINTENEKAHQVVRYLCRGRTNLTIASMESTKVLANEVMEYGPLFCYVLDVCMEIWLWRGTVPVFGIFYLWFPIQSAILWAATTIAVNRPYLIPSIFLYYIAWILLSLNYHNSTHPNPWNRCRSVNETNMVLLTGKKSIMADGITVTAQQGVEEAKALEQLDKFKSQRVGNFFNDAQSAALKYYKIYKTTMVEKHAIETEDTASGWSFMGNMLYYVHMMLYYMTTYLRMGRNLVNWKTGYSAHKFTMYCVILATAYWMVPMFLWHWLARLLVLAFFGPHMKLVDMLFVHPILKYKSKHELMKMEGDEYPPSTLVDDVLNSEAVQKMRNIGRVAAEDAMKLKAMRELKYGKYSQLIPFFDTSRFPYVPLPSSTAVPYDTADGFKDLPASEQVWDYVPGQKFEGTMIHQNLQNPEKSLQNFEEKHAKEE